MKLLSFLCLITPFLICAQTDSIMLNSIQLGDSSIKVIQHIPEPDANILFLNIHEDEYTSIEVMKAFCLVNPINYTYLNHNQTRRISFNLGRKVFSVDPNRIYTPKGRKKTIKPWWRLFTKNALAETKILADQILKLIEPYDTIVTMHNNTDINYSIKSYLPGGGEAQNTAQVHIGENWDTDDFVYTTDLRFFKYLKSKDINVILQDNQKYVNDGSLSVYCGIKEIPYINIEAQKGHYKEQYKLTEIVYEMLSKF